MTADITAPDASKIDRLEVEIMRLPKAKIEILHHFSPGIYMREMRAPAGSIITGCRHRTKHLNVVAAGSLTVINEIDGTRRTIAAPYAFASEPGTRRAAIVHEDLSWITVHATEETDIAKLEAMLVEPHANHLLENLNQPEVLQ